MQIKDKYKIGAHTFDVNFTHEKDGFPNMGEARHWHNRFIIQTDMVPSKQECSLLHEVFHEINIQQGWKLEENQITAISENFYQFLVENDLLKD